MLLSPQYILWALVIASLLHNLEEFVWPGGFYREFKLLLKKAGFTIGLAEIIIINFLFWTAVLSAASAGLTYPFWGLVVCLLVMINGLLHAVVSGVKKKYFPGLITGLFLYIPLGILATLQNPLSTGQKWNCLLIATALHSIPFWLVLIRRLIIK